MATEIKDFIDQAAEELEKEEMASGEHGEIGSILIGYLFNHVYPNKLGKLFEGQTTFEFPGLIARKEPDIAFVRAGRLPNKVVRSNVTVAPDLAVEIISPSDPLSEVAEKAHLYQQLGVRLVWAIDPYNQIVFVYHQNDPIPMMLRPDDDLDGEDVLPGFTLKVSKLFEYGE